MYIPFIHRIEKYASSFRLYVRMSKNRCYESPYTVTGGIQHTGIEEAPKDIPMIRPMERGKLITLRKKICIFL